MNTKISLAFLWFAIQQPTWSQDKPDYLWSFTHQKSGDSVDDLSLELFTDLETTTKNPKVVQSQRIRIDKNGWDMPKTIRDCVYNPQSYIPEDSSPFYPLDLQITVGMISYDFHVEAYYCPAALLHDNKSIRQTILYKGVVVKTTSFTVLIPKQIIDGDHQTPLETIIIRLWSTQNTIPSTFMRTLTIPEEMTPAIQIKNGELSISSSVMDTSQDDLCFKIDVNDDGNLAMGSI
ncbi:MAG: hypothetical protein KF798_03330 [Candidatus Paracaedibacteraceae bacterium]|nr:hypothetical protein [Candidatus Paracaedibacteraceae bacterium]